MKARGPFWTVAASVAFFAAAVLSACAMTDHNYDDPPELPALGPRQGTAFPAWIPAEVRGDSVLGATNVLGMACEWLFLPPPGRPGYLSIAYSNRTDQSFIAERTSSPMDAEGGLLFFALEAGGVRRSVAGFPAHHTGVMEGFHFVTGEVQRLECRLPTEMLADAAGAEGLAVAFVGRDPYSGLVYWADCAPLSAPAAAQAPGTAGSNEWSSLVGYWRDHGIPLSRGGMACALADYPELAPFFPGVVLDDTLPEAFRLEFANRMPRVNGYDPRLVLFILGAPDKDAPLVTAAMRVLSRNFGATPVEDQDRIEAGQCLYYASLNVIYPVTFRMHAANLFRVPTPYEDFNARTEPNLKLLAADDFRQCDGRDFPLDMRTTLRTALTALSNSTDPFVPGPLAGKYPDNATIGQVAAIILADLEAKWAAAQPWPE